MYVRVGTMEVPPDRLDDAVASFRRQLVPAARGQDGYVGAAFLLERTTGKTLLLAWWDTEEAMQASRERASENRARAAQAIGAAPPTVVEYEVAVWDSLGDRWRPSSPRGDDAGTTRSPGAPFSAPGSTGGGRRWCC